MANEIYGVNSFNGAETLQNANGNAQPVEYKTKPLPNDTVELSTKKPVDKKKIALIAAGVAAAAAVVAGVVIWAKKGDVIKAKLAAKTAAKDIGKLSSEAQTLTDDVAKQGAEIQKRSDELLKVFKDVTPEDGILKATGKFNGQDVVAHFDDTASEGTKVLKKILEGSNIYEYEGGTQLVKYKEGVTALKDGGSKIAKMFEFTPTRGVKKYYEDVALSSKGLINSASKILDLTSGRAGLIFEKGVTYGYDEAGNRVSRSIKNKLGYNNDGVTYCKDLVKDGEKTTKKLGVTARLDDNKVIMESCVQGGTNVKGKPAENIIKRKISFDDKGEITKIEKDIALDANGNNKVAKTLELKDGKWVDVDKVAKKSK